MSNAPWNPYEFRKVQLRTHSLFAPYVDQDLQNRWFSFGGDAYVNTNKHVRLTQDRPSETGWLWSRLPLTTLNFQIDVEFKLTSKSSHLFGDGFAVWLTNRRTVSGPVFGFENRFDGIGIFVDTFANAPHSYAFPRIMAMIGDGQTEYNVGDDGAATDAGGCYAKLLNQEIATKLRITYIKDHFLDVKVHHRAWDEWSPCFTIKNPRMPQSPFLGFSALTGDVSESHDIVAVTTSSLILNTHLVTAKGGSLTQNRIPTKSGTFGTFIGSLIGLILKFVFAATLLAIGYAGWRAYNARHGGSGSSIGVPWDAKRF